jgi:hypothetical protein
VFVAIAHEGYWIVEAARTDADALARAIPELRFYQQR